VGSLTIPVARAVYFDTDALIYSVEKIAPYDALLLPIWQAARDGAVAVVTSELALLEVLVKPLQIADSVLEATYRTLLTATSDVTLITIDRVVLEQSAQLRATVNIKTPDAIHAVTALRTDCALFLSNDLVYRRVPGLPLALLDDYVTT
jgi:predicted nucleic acid-binding protein